MTQTCPQCGKAFQGGVTVQGTVYCSRECTRRSAVVPGVVATVILMGCIGYLVWFVQSCSAAVGH